LHLGREEVELQEEEPMKLTLTPLIFALVATLPLAAAALDTAKFAQVTGVRMDGGAKVNIVEGQTLAAKVVNVAALTKLGLKGSKNGDVVQVTFHGKKGWSFLHVPSGHRLEYVEVGVDDFFD
jgi:hypothetical protein